MHICQHCQGTGYNGNCPKCGGRGWGGSKLAVSANAMSRRATLFSDVERAFRELRSTIQEMERQGVSKERMPAVQLALAALCIEFDDVREIGDDHLQVSALEKLLSHIAAVNAGLGTEHSRARPVARSRNPSPTFATFQQEFRAGLTSKLLAKVEFSKEFSHSSANARVIAHRTTILFLSELSTCIARITWVSEVDCLMLLRSGRRTLRTRVRFKPDDSFAVYESHFGQHLFPLSAIRKSLAQVASMKKPPKRTGTKIKRRPGGQPIQRKPPVTSDRQKSEPTIMAQAFSHAGHGNVPEQPHTQLDATKDYWSIREQGRFGSHPSHDSFDDE